MKTMTKEKLAEILKMNIRSNRLLQVVSFGGVKVNGEIITLKNRPSYDFNEEDIIHYEEEKDLGYHYNELSGKAVVFDHKLFNKNGQETIKEYETSLT